MTDDTIRALEQAMRLSLLVIRRLADSPEHGRLVVDEATLEMVEKVTRLAKGMCTAVDKWVIDQRTLTRIASNDALRRTSSPELIERS